MRGEPVYRGIVGIDIEGFNRTAWTDPIRARLRARLHTLVDDALTHAKIDPSLTIRSDTGDGLWLLADAHVPTTRLLHPLATSLASGLATGNRRTPAPERLRLRVVVHAGELLQDAYGHTGQSWNHAARLLDAEATRAVLAACPAADMVLVVPDVLYDGIVRQAYEGIDPAGWQPVRVHTKETRTRAWVRLPGLADQPALPAVLAAPRAGPASPPIPRELPRPPGDFTGRAGELAALWELLGAGPPGGDGAAGTGAGAWPPARPRGRPGRPVVISAIAGMAGIGKSALALQVANQLADAGAFPDGQLYVNLQGATPGLPPLAPLDALGQLLRSLGLDPGAIPTTVQEAAARFRSLAAERRLLLMLDNAASAQQVHPLLPASPTCAVLVTSRQILATLDGAHRLHLDVLPPQEALALLGRLASPQRLTADPPAAAEVVRLCGYLPLAIRIAGARLAARPGWPVRVLAERLADATGRLEELAADELAVQASFDVSLHTLTESANPADRAVVAAFGLLSLPDGQDLSLSAAASLLDQPHPTARRLLERLVDAQLIETPRPGRYQFHDLVRLYARQHASRQPEPERLAALTRLVGFYTATTWHTVTVLHPHTAGRLSLADPRRTRGGLRFEDAPAALAWLEAERANLLAAITQGAQADPATPGLPADLPGQLACALWTFFDVRGYWHDSVRANQTALQLAHRTGDLAAQGAAHSDLGSRYVQLGRYEEAIACLQEALALFRQLPAGRWGPARTLRYLGIAYGMLGRYEEAVSCLQESLGLSQGMDDRHDQAHCLCDLATIYCRMRRYEEAIACLQESHAFSRELGDRWGQADSLSGLGDLHRRMGQHAEAIACLQDSLATYQELSHRQGQASTLHGLGAAYGRSGRYAEAIACLQDSLALSRDLDDRHGQTLSLRELGDILRAAAQHQQAHTAWQQALSLCEALQLSEADGIRARLATPPSELPEPTSRE